MKKETKPDTLKVSVQRGDRYLIAQQRLHGTLFTDGIEASLKKRAKSLTKAGKRLMEAARKAGMTGDTSLILIEVR